MNKKQIIKKVRKEIKPQEIEPKEKPLPEIYDIGWNNGYETGYTTAKNKTKEKYEIGIFIVVLALLTALAIYKSL